MTYHNTFPRKMFFFLYYYARKFPENSMLVENQLPHATASAWKIISHKPKPHSTWTGKNRSKQNILSKLKKCMPWMTNNPNNNSSWCVCYVYCLWLFAPNSNDMWRGSADNIFCPSVLPDYALQCVHEPMTTVYSPSPKRSESNVSYRLAPCPPEKINYFWVLIFPETAFTKENC